ncbi:MAG: hypothetical protein IPL28_02890 [Chloroflexi bacterium]|nr:hypothetical protein [Chloroflexota bacterium]
MCKYPGGIGGAGWDCARTGFDANSVWRAGIGSFSDWAVGDEVGPTAVTLSTFSASNTPTIPLLALTTPIPSCFCLAVGYSSAAGSKQPDPNQVKGQQFAKLVPFLPNPAQLSRFCHGRFL